MVFVFATGTMVNANSSVEKIYMIESMIEEVLIGRDCVDYARSIVAITQINNMIYDSNDPVYFEWLLSIYNAAYEQC